MNQETYTELETKFGRGATQVIVYLVNSIEIHQGKKKAEEDLKLALAMVRA